MESFAVQEISLVRQAGFSSAHRYFNPSLSESENQKIYGTLYRRDGFGHNFRLEAHFVGSVDPLTGMIVNLMDVDQWLKEVSSLLDHRFINELPAFSGHAVTTETIASFLYEELKKRVLSASTQGLSLKKIRLFEGESTWVDIFPGK